VFIELRERKYMHSEIEFEAFYDAMGEGVLASFIDGGESKLFDRQGLQHIIVERKREGKDTSVEEKALAQMNLVMVPRGV